MIPFLHFWHLNIPTFGLMLWVAAVAAAIVMDRAFRREHIEADAIGMVAVAVVAGIVGAKLWHVLDTPEEFREMGWRVLWDSAGFAWFGGLVFGILALLIQGWRARIGALRILDLASAAAAIGYGVGRIGCLLSGDGDYGIPSNLPWAMGFPHGLDPTPPGVRVHPTPIYEFVVAMFIGWWLWARGSKPRPSGWIVGEYLIWTGLARFLVEFIRRNQPVLFGLSNAQLASVGSVVAGAALLVWASRQKITEPQKSRTAGEKSA